MATKLGRNEECHCGSKKKYKRCCMKNEIYNQATRLLDLEWYKVRKMEGVVINKYLYPYLKSLPYDFLEYSIKEILPKNFPEWVDMENLSYQFFLPWVLFNKIPEDDFKMKDFNPNLTISQNYVINNEQDIPKNELCFMKLMNKTYYSFYSIQKVELYKSILVKDIFLGTEHFIKELKGTEHLKRDNVVFARILNMNEQSIFVGMAPLLIENDYHHFLIDFKNELYEEGITLTKDFLRNAYSEFTYIYLDLVIRSYNKSSPTIMNTDNEPIQISESYFDISIPPKEVVNKIYSLSFLYSAKEILDLAEIDDNGIITSIDFQWIRECDNTVLGNIIIEINKLILSTNSENRTKEGKELLKRYLGDSIVFKITTMESADQLWKKASIDKNNISEDIINQKSEDLMSLPEVKEKLNEMANKHWEDWLIEPIEGLGNISPIQSSKTEKGREHIEALLLSYDLVEDSDNPFGANIEHLRSKLGI